MNAVSTSIAKKGDVDFLAANTHSFFVLTEEKPFHYERDALDKHANFV